MKRCCMVFAVVWVVVGVVGVYFGDGLLDINSVPTATKSAVRSEAEELATTRTRWVWDWTIWVI